MKMNVNRNRGGFSLIELVIVVVIIGIIGAIAIPRMSRGTTGAADSALVSDLATLRNAIDLYAAEHGGTFPTKALFADQMTKLTKADGSVDDGTGKGGGYIYGPYLRKVPALPVGTNKGEAGITDTLGTAGFGWNYNQSTGEIQANLNALEKDEAGKAYKDF
jgi:prepilin-type N-terminal cleavage/methylation domain-containing protein